MSKNKQLPDFTPDEIARVLAVIDFYLCSAETAVGKFRDIKRKDDSGLAERSHTYWRNVVSGLKWLRSAFSD